MPKKQKKISKQDAGYMKRAATPQTCANCVMYKFAGRCTLVKGSISYEGWCRHWTAK